MDKTVRLSSGYQMPLVGLGTGGLREDVDKILPTALENGYKHIDTAFVYYNEKGIGKALKSWFEKGNKREDLFITSKLPFFGNRPADVSKYLKMSLDDLALEYVDMYLIHAPVPMVPDETGKEGKKIDGKNVLEPTIDLAGIWKEMEKEVKAGRIKSIGLSNFNKSQIAEVWEKAEIKPSNLQVEVHAYFQQRPLREFCKQHNIIVTAYHPLGSQTRNPNPEVKLADLFKNEKILKMAEKYKKTPAQILLRHGIQGGLIVIPKSSNEQRLKENIEIFDFSLSDDEMEEMNSLDVGAKARVYDFKSFVPGLKDHPYFPFRKEEV